MEKDEKIYEAYGRHYNFFKHFIDENGWLDKLKIALENVVLIIILTNEIECESQINNAYSIRPKSLSGIENNNGWVKIKSGLDFPKDKNVFYKYCIDGIPYNINCNLMNLKANLSYYEDKLTHYKVCEQEKPPIY